MQDDPGMAAPGDENGSHPRMVVAVGASAGGVEALSRLVGRLSPDFPGAVVVVLHVAATGTTVLPQILDRAGPLPASAAEEGARLSPGRVYVAPSDCHVLVEDGGLRLWSGPRENGHRPAVDPLFRSVARAYGPAAVGVVLSGTRDDGTAGLMQIKERGGRALVQDPADALYDGMPRSAIAHADIDEVLPVEALADRLLELATREADPMIDGPELLQNPDPEDDPTRITCPECGGVLHAHDRGALKQYRCSVGHAYSPESLEDEQVRQVESALWAATRLLDDRAAFLRGMAGRAAAAGHHRSAESFAVKAEEAKARSDILRELAEAQARGGH
jgi:two-component system, chemotaxis family, protein-glutamate methylesterase/glutaminase